jgi:hypothetical protein
VSSFLRGDIGQITMEFNKLVFGGLALGCVAAAGAGGYLAARQNPAPRTEQAVVSTPTDATAAPAAPDAPRAVAESEGVITPEAPAPTAAPAPPAPAAETPATVTPRRESTPRPSRPAPVPSSVPVKPTRTARSEPVAPAPAPAASAPAASSGGMWEPRASVEPERASMATREPEPPPPPPAPENIELVVPSDAVLGLQIERTVSSDVARVEDRVDARVTRDVRVGDRVAIPAGSLVQGSVMEVERGGKVRERAKLGVRFHTVVLADGTRLNIKTDSVVREGTSPTNESAAKIGGAAAGGAILGAILGGGKGAVLGGAIGAAGGTAATMAGKPNPAVLAAGSTVSVRVQQPVTVTVEK